MHPSTTPLELWTDGWLVMEVAAILNKPIYLLLTDSERASAKFPATRKERIEFIQKQRRETRKACHPM